MPPLEPEVVMHGDVVERIKRKRTELAAVSLPPYTAADLQAADGKKDELCMLYLP